jgi:hypothetical protein
MKDKKKDKKKGEKKGEKKEKNKEKNKGKIISKEAVKEHRKKEFLAWYDFLCQFDWQWIATLTVEDGLSSDAVGRRLLSWIRKLQTSEHMQVGYVAAMCENKGHLHVHLLMVGRRRCNGQMETLENVDPRKWSDEWPFYAKIEYIEDPFRGSRYVASHILKKKCDKCEFDFYNKTLVKYFEF